MMLSFTTHHHQRILSSPVHLKPNRGSSTILFISALFRVDIGTGRWCILEQSST